MPNTENEIKHTGIEIIAAERQRQIEQEGWTPEHDDAHASGELIDAAICYAAAADGLRAGATVKEIEWRILSKDFDTLIWPWESEWLKVSNDPARNLAKAGALIAAEIDRLQRAKAKGTTP